jgi:PAS domain S-box-containing protein
MYKNHDETIRVPATRELVYHQVTCSPAGNIEGDIIGAVSVACDTRERKMAEGAKNQLAAIVQGADDAIISKTLDGIITSWNRGAEIMYGYSAAEMIGQSVSLLTPSDHSDEMSCILGAIARNERIVHFETVRLRKDGQRINISLTVSPLMNSDGEVIGASAIARDITERKQLEAESNQAKENLRLATKSGKGSSIQSPTS